MRPTTATVSIKVNPEASLFRSLRGSISSIVLLALFLTCPAVTAQTGSETPFVKVDFRVKPPNAELLLREIAGGEFKSVGQVRNLDRLEIPPVREKQEFLRYKFQVKLWFGQIWQQEEYESIDISKLKKSGRIPSSGTLDLTEQMTWTEAIQARHSPISFGSIALLTFGSLVALFKFRHLPAQMLAPKPSETTTYGDYLTTGVLGKGGMGVVYAAKSPNGDEVAIKSVLPALSEDQEFRKRFEREIKACINLKHPNLLALYGYGVDSAGSLYSISELLRGQTLKSHIKSGLFDPPQLASDVIEHIGSALDYLHGQNLLHRDVKPDNIFVSETGQLKLMDLGLVRGDDLTVLTQTGNVLGTPAYMAPEQANNNSVEASDQYALGIILYEILTGLRPFRQTKVELLVYQHTSVKPEPPSNLEPRIPEDVEAAILRMLEKNPQDRFATMADAQAALSDRLLSLSWKEDDLETLNTPLRKQE